jgi:hypothetical protein
MVELRDHMVHIKNAGRVRERGKTKKRTNHPEDSRGIKTVPSEYLRERQDVSSSLM